MRPVTLFLSNIAWDFAWQRHQTLATLFARDSDVVFCEVPGVRRVGWRDLPRIWARLRQVTAGQSSAAARETWPAGLRVVRPFVLPATNRLFCALNAWLLDRWLKREPGLRAGVDLIVNYSSARTALQLLDRVPHRRLVYDCTDNWLAVEGIPAFLPADEKALLARADLTLVPSRRLEELKRPAARRLERLPHGAWVERFLLEPRQRTPGEAVTLLYYGHLHRQHLNFDLLEQLARLRPDWWIVLVGAVKTPHVFPANVRLVGQQPHERLRDFIASADVLLLPYVLNEYTRSVLPAKIYECLATGRPIVAAPLPELTADFTPYLRFAEDAAGFASAVESALASDTAAGRASRATLARNNTWENRYRRLQELLAALPSKGAT
jgi:glycosyltransferase involved in cell wall biosynthesis